MAKELISEETTYYIAILSLISYIGILIITFYVTSNLLYDMLIANIMFICLYFSIRSIEYIIYFKNKNKKIVKLTFIELAEAEEWKDILVYKQLQSLMHITQTTKEEIDIKFEEYLKDKYGVPKEVI